MHAFGIFPSKITGRAGLLCCILDHYCYAIRVILLFIRSYAADLKCPDTSVALQSAGPDLTVSVSSHQAYLVKVNWNRHIFFKTPFTPVSCQSHALNHRETPLPCKCVCVLYLFLFCFVCPSPNLVLVFPPLFTLCQQQLLNWKHVQEKGQVSHTFSPQRKKVFGLILLHKQYYRNQEENTVACGNRNYISIWLPTCYNLLWSRVTLTSLNLIIF